MCQEYNDKRMKLHTLIHRIATVLTGYNTLLRGFNTFLPPSMWVQVDDSTPGPVGSSAQQRNVTLHLAVVSLVCCAVYYVLGFGAACGVIARSDA
jgi:histone deacetylase complex regulatory component SIN3